MTSVRLGWEDYLGGKGYGVECGVGVPGPKTAHTLGGEV